MAKRILIVDDDAGFAENLRINLEAAAYAVRVENDSTHALATAREFCPDLVLLDLVMPGDNGGAVAERLQRDQMLETVPIVVLTATLPQTTAREIAGRTVLSKPVSFRRLAACIEKQLARPRACQESSARTE